MTYYLVRTIDEDDRPEHTAQEIARVVAVNFHEEVAARPWQVDLDTLYVIDAESAWHRFNSKGNPVVPEEEQADV